MAMHRSSFWFDDNKLYVSREGWSDLAADPSVIGLAGVVASAVEVIKRQGAFIIDGGEEGIFRRIDSVPEFQQFVSDVDSARRKLGLRTLAA